MSGQGRQKAELEIKLAELRSEIEISVSELNIRITDDLKARFQFLSQSQKSGMKSLSKD
jgi:hypothetical protein